MRVLSALLTDAEDDSYDLSWLHWLPSDALPAIRELRRLLEHDPDPGSEVMM